MRSDLADFFCRWALVRPCALGSHFALPLQGAHSVQCIIANCQVKDAARFRLKGARGAKK